jgi:hypothetical protein
LGFAITGPNIPLLIEDFHVTDSGRRQGCAYGEGNRWVSAALDLYTPGAGSGDAVWEECDRVFQVN